MMGGSDRPYDSAGLVPDREDNRLSKLSAMTSIWAHRGASAYAPENTLPAFALAIEQRADGVELDLQRTADGELVVIHDETVDRTTTGSGKVVDLTLEQLRSFDASCGMSAFAGTQIPTLREVFELLGPCGLMINVELKNSIEFYPGMEAELEALVAEAGMADQVIYSSFNHYSLRTLREAGTTVPLGILYSDGVVDPWVYAEYLGVQAIHPPWEVLVAPGVVEECHARNILVHPWTIEPGQARRLADLGVDALITNFPDLTRAAIS